MSKEGTHEQNASCKMIDLPFLNEHRWNLIKNRLSNLVISDFKSFQETICHIQQTKKEMSVELLEIACQDTSHVFFSQVLPFIQSLVLQSPKIFDKRNSIQILQQETNQSISLNRKECACILANAFFCTFERDSSEFKWDLLGSINFDDLFSKPMSHVHAKASKLKLILHYFYRLCQNDDFERKNIITFSRRYIRRNNLPDWKTSTNTLTKFIVRSDTSIHDHPDALQVDFANSYPGGYVLSYGAAQEEIQFATHPELIVCRLFCEKLRVTESLIVTGAERFSNHKGYGSKLEFGGDYIDGNKSENGQIMNKIVCIDAFKFEDIISQWSRMFVDRELNKAFSGFSSVTLAGVSDASSQVKKSAKTASTSLSSSNESECISTGNWGCGIFKGDKELKALIQWIAASEAKRNIIYNTFGQSNQEESLHKFVCALRSRKDLTVGKLYCALLKIEELLEQEDEFGGTPIPGTFREVCKNLNIEWNC